MQQHSSDILSSLYAGEMTPSQAFELLQEDEAALLVDVRTLPEWTFVGYPDLSTIGKEIIRLSWRFYPTMQLNETFTTKLTALVSDKNIPMLFICRTGGRSLDAAIAMTALGYTQCYNVTDGFEGEKNTEYHRGVQSGWKAEHLPWRQD